MAKKYNQQTYTGSFSGSAQSLGFSPVKAVDESKQFQQRKKELMRDSATQQRHLQASYQVQNAQLSADRAKSNAQAGALKGLLGIVGQSTGALAKYAKEQEAAAQKAEKEQEQEFITNQQLQSMGMMGVEMTDPEMPQDTTKGVLEATDDQTLQVEAEGQAINEVASEIEPFAPGEAHNLKQSATQVRYTGVQGNIYSARSGHRGYLDARMAEIPDAMRPRTEAEAMQLIAGWNKDYFTESGVFNDPETRKLAARELYASTGANSQSVAKAMSSGARKLDEKANASQLSGTLFSAGQSGESAESLWRMASDGVAFGNMGYNGRSAASNEAAMKELVGVLVQGENVNALIDLRDTAKIPGNPRAGTLGDAYGPIIDQAIEQARQGKRQEWQSHQADIKMTVEQMTEDYYNNPTPEGRQQLAENLSRMGPAGRAEAQRLINAGLNVDPEYELNLAQRAANGEYIGQDELRKALDSGRIRESVYKQQMKNNKDAQIDSEVRSMTKGMDSVIKQTMTATAGDFATLTAAQKQEVQIRSTLLKQDLESRLQAEIRANPALKGNEREMQIMANNILSELVQQPEYKLIAGENYGQAQWGAPIRTQQFADTSALITVAPGQQDFTKLSPEQILNNNIVPRSELNIQDDYILNQDDVVAAAQSPGQYSTRIKTVAKGLGVSPKALVEGQLRRYNMPSSDALQDIKASEPQNLDLQGGYTYIQDTLGFPPRGAAYLTSAIDHESAWRGDREWGQVAGDGTNRNGGLISWASWSGKPARLGKIERHYGTSIANIGETQQLEYMKLEMQKDYSAAYRVFMNPNASSADLQWAVSAYWGFDPKYTGSRWTDAERYISRPPV